MPPICVGDKIKFVSEKRRYTVRAVVAPFVVCTKPHNPTHEFIYTILDFSRGIRGPVDSLWHGYGFGTDEGCELLCADLVAGEAAVSTRQGLELDIERIDTEGGGR